MQDLLVALALVLVIEGIMPFVSPQKWRQTILLVAEQSDQSLRTIGLVCMVIGVILVTLIRNV